MAACRFVALLAGDPVLVAGSRDDVLGAYVADELSDRHSWRSALLITRGAGSLYVARGLRFSGLEGLQRDVAADQLLLENVDGGLDTLLGGQRSGSTASSPAHAILVGAASRSAWPLMAAWLSALSTPAGPCLLTVNDESPFGSSLLREIAVCTLSTRSLCLLGGRLRSGQWEAGL